MAWASIVGLIISLSIFAASIKMSTDNWRIFINYPSILMVLGGAFAASFVSFRGRYVTKALFMGLKTLQKQKINPQSLKDDIKRFMDWARKFNKSGVEGLEEVKDPDVFVSRCIYLAKQEYPVEEYRNMLEDFIDHDYDRQMVSANILSKIGSIAPAFGMVGTLVGLIIMLQSMGNDPSGIGRGLAVALITTLYGVMFAKMLFEPFAGKIKEVLSIQKFRRILLLEGFVLLLSRKDPYFIMDRLNCKLDPGLLYDDRIDLPKTSGERAAGTNS